MGGSVIFYTYGSTLELNGQQLTAGMLTADLLNLSPDEYRPMSKRMKQVTSLAEEYEQSGSIELWWKLNEELAALCGVLRRYAVFRLLLDAMSNPTRTVSVAAQKEKLFGDYGAFLALGMTLLDNEVTFSEIHFHRKKMNL